MTAQAGEIRRAAHIDLPALASLVQTLSSGAAAGRSGVQPATIRRTDIDNDEIWLVRIGRGVMGFYWMVCAPKCSLKMLVVADYARNAGIGSALIGHMKVRAQIAGAREVRIEANTEAATFFERMGAVDDPLIAPADKIWAGQRQLVIKIEEVRHAPA